MRLRILPIIAAVCALACRDSSGERQNDLFSVRVPPRALTQVRWIEGTWKGTGAEGTTQEPFYERYTLVNDSTLVVESLQDSTLQLVTDTTRYEQHGDSLSNPGRGPRWIATFVSPDSIHFEPLSGTKNRFVFRRGDDSSWTAVLDWPPVDSVARHRVYLMMRIK